MSMLFDEVDSQDSQEEAKPPQKRCSATTKAGAPCRATSVGADGLCSYHSGRAGFTRDEIVQKATENRRKARQEKAAARRLDALDWAAKAVQEQGYAIAQAFVEAAKRGDWRASEALMNRIYGKPEETVRQVDANPATAVLKSMSLDEKLELLARLQRGELGSQDVAGVLEP